MPFSKLQCHVFVIHKLNPYSYYYSMIYIVLSGEVSIAGELRSHGVNDEGSPIITASEGFSVGEVTQV